MTNRLFNLGDSLTDQNNTYLLTGFLLNRNRQPKFPEALYPWPCFLVPATLLGLKLDQLPGKPYSEGQFSDGETFMSQLARFLGKTGDKETDFINLAHGGSATVSNWDFFFSLIRLSNEPWGALKVVQQLYNYFSAGQIFFPSLHGQALFSTQTYSPFQPNDLFAIASGANDNMFRIWNPQLVSSTQEGAIRALYRNGARIIFWESIPDYTLAPCLRHAPDAVSLQQNVRQQNAHIRARILAVREDYPDLRLIFVDTAKIFRLLLEEARRLGMNTDTSCSKIVFKGCTINGGIDMLKLGSGHNVPTCQDSDQYFFFDAGHPGRRIHRWIALLVCRLLEDQYFDIQCPAQADFDLDGVLERYYSHDDADDPLQEKQLSPDYCPVIEPLTDT